MALIDHLDIGKARSSATRLVAWSPIISLRPPGRVDISCWRPATATPLPRPPLVEDDSTGFDWQMMRTRSVSLLPRTPPGPPAFYGSPSTSSLAAVTTARPRGADGGASQTDSSSSTSNTPSTWNRTREVPRRGRAIPRLLATTLAPGALNRLFFARLGEALPAIRRPFRAETRPVLYRRTKGRSRGNVAASWERQVSEVPALTVVKLDRKPASRTDALRVSLG